MKKMIWSFTKIFTKNSTIFFKVEKEQKVEVLDNKNGFIKVLGLDNGFIGWIKEESFGTN